MNPIRLVAHSYRTFDRLDLDLPEGCVAVLGQNGAGKSSIVDAIDTCLFGPQSRSLADLHAEGAEDDLLLELTFEHAGELYRIRRTYSPRGRGKTTLDLEQFEGEPTIVVDGRGEHLDELGGFVPLTCESAKATQERIEDILGLSRETFRASAFLAQGDGAAFTEAQPRDRKRILGDVLGLGRYAILRDRARADAQAAQKRLAQLDGVDTAARQVADTRKDVEIDLDEAKSAEIEAVDQLADAERAHAELAQRWQAAKQAASERQIAESNLQAARGKRDHLDALNTAAEEALTAQQITRDELATLATTGQLAEIEAELERIQATETEWRTLVADREALVARAHDARRRRDDLLVRSNELLAKKADAAEKADALEIAEHATCQTCGQTVDGEARARAIDAYRMAAEAFDRDASDLAHQCAAITVPEVPSEIPVPTVAGVHIEDARAAAARTAAQRRADQQQRARLEERLVALQATIAGRPAPDDLLEADRRLTAHERTLVSLGDPVDVAVIEREGAEAKRRLDQARTTLDSARTVHARCQERLAQVDAAESQLIGNALAREELDRELDLCVALDRAFSPDGIPALIVENSAIPQIETDANRMLQDLGTSYRVELRTQAALKSGDGLRDTLDVIVCTETGERPYETFSGGERTRLNLALRIALARLLAHRRGADSRLLVIDEPEYLDEAGTAALVDVLRSLQGDFDKCYLISHVPALRDSFDEVLTVVKGDDGRSRIEAWALDKPLDAVVTAYERAKENDRADT